MQSQTIPRIRKDVLTFMPLTCTWSRELMENVKKTCLSKSPLKGWIPIKIHIVDNPDLEEIFEDRKAAMRKMGRTEEELTEELCFMAESWKSVVSMCKYGVRCVEKKCNILGDTRAGIHLNRNYDMLLRFMTFRNFITARCVVVFKVVPGRVKKVMPRFKGRTLLHPSKHYDAHVSMMDPDPTISVNEGLANNFIYIYQLDDETKVPYQHPRQAVPYAVIQLRQPYKMTVSRPRPFSSFRDRFLAKMRTKDSRESRTSSIGKRRDDSLTRSSSNRERHRRRSSRSYDSDSDGSPSRRRKRSRTPKEVHKRSKTPTRKSSDKESLSIGTKVERDQSNIHTKLQKIEEEIKLRQSKLTKLRHIKISQDSEKMNQDIGDDTKNTNIAVLQSNTVESSEQGVVQTPITCDFSDSFSPKITSVYSTSDIKDFEMNDTFSPQYRELSSGASTPTLDEPGDQSSEHTNKLVELLKNKDNPKETQMPPILQKEEGYQLPDVDNKRTQESNSGSEVNDVNKEAGGELTLKQENEKCVKEEANDTHIGESHTTGNTIKTEVVQKTDNVDIRKEKVETETVTDSLEKPLKQETSTNKVENNIQQATHTDKDLDIKQLFREAIYQMDPSDLYELLTQKLAGGDEEPVEEAEEIVTEDIAKTTQPDIDTECQQSNDETILDLSCKPKPVSKLETKNVKKNIENNVTGNNEKDSSNVENKQNIDVKTGEYNTQSEKPISVYVDSISVKNECNVMDSLDILASVASELLPAKSDSVGLHQVNVNMMPVQKIKDKNTMLSGKIVSVNRRSKSKSSENERGEQEYIFDAETFSQKVHKTGLCLNETGHGVRGKGVSVAKFVEQSLQVDESNKISSQSFDTKNVNKNKRPTVKSTTKTTVVNSRPKNQVTSNQATNVESDKNNISNLSDSCSDDSRVKQVLASTKRKTANSVAAAFAATEQPDVLPENLTSSGSKQGNKRTQKQNSVPANTENSFQNNIITNQSTTAKQRVLRSGKILPTTTQERPPSRGNLFEKFYSVTSSKSDEKMDNSPFKNQMASSITLQPVKEQGTTNQNELNTGCATVKQEPDFSDNIDDSTSLSTIASPLKDKTHLRTVKKQSSNIQNELAKNINDRSYSSQNLSDKTDNHCEILTSKKPTSNKVILNKDSTTTVIQKDNPDKSSDASAISQVTSKDTEEKKSREQPTTIQDIATMIKQEPVYTELSDPSRAGSPVRTSDNIEKVPKMPHVLDESIVDLMDKQVTEEMKQSDIRLKTIKKEPLSPRDDSFTPHNNEKQDGKAEGSQLSTGSKRSNITIASESQDKEYTSEFDTSDLKTSVKEEPVSPSKELSNSFNLSIEKTSNTTKSVKTVTNQKDGIVKEITRDNSRDTNEISTELDKTLKDLEQVIGIFSQKVRKNSGDVDSSSSNDIEQQSKLTQKNSNENKSKSDITSTSVRTHYKDSATISEKKETFSSGEDDMPKLSPKTPVKSKRPKQTSSNIMSIEVITGNNPAKKSPSRNKVSQTITLTTASKSKNVISNTAPLNKDKSPTMRPTNVNKSGIKTKSYGDDSIRTTRVLQSAIQECSSSGRSIPKRIKKEPVTEDEYYGINRSSAFKQSPKKQIDSTKSKLIEKRKLPEPIQKFKSIDRKEGNTIHGIPSYWKKRPSNKTDNSRSTFSNPLDTIRTEYSSLKHKDEHKRSRGNDDDSFTRKDNISKESDRQRSSSSISSQSSSVESPTRDFTKRDRHLPSNSERNYLKYSSASPLKYQSSSSGSVYVKSKWDSNETIRGSCTDRNPDKAFTSNREPLLPNPYSASFNPTYYEYNQENKNSQSTSVMNYQNLSSRDNRTSTFTTNMLSSSTQGGLSHGSFSNYKTGKQNQNHTYSNASFSRQNVKREKSNSLERPYNSIHKRTRSISNERGDGYEQRRHRSDSRDRKRSRLSDRSRDRSDSRDRDRNNRSRLKRRLSGSRGRDRSSSSEYNRSHSPPKQTAVYQNSNNRFDFYRPHTSSQQSSSRGESGIRGSLLNTPLEPNDADITNTLSKAMSTLLKKIIYDDKGRDNSKEGRMADMVLDMVKARVSGEQNPNQQLSQSFDSKQIHTTAKQNPYDNGRTIEQRSNSRSTLTSTQTGHRRENETRSRYSNIRKSPPSSTRRPTYTTTHKTPPIFNSILIPKYNPNFRTASSFTGTRGRGSSYYNRPWSRARFTSRLSSSSRSTYRGSSNEKYSKIESRPTREKKSPSK